VITRNHAKPTRKPAIANKKKKKKKKGKKVYLWVTINKMGRVGLDNKKKKKEN